MKTLKVNEYVFEIVDSIPKGYSLWNIGHNMQDDYLPLVQTYEGTYEVNTNTMKAVYIKDAQVVLQAIGRGQGTIKKMETYIKRNKNPKMLSTKRHVDKLIKAVEILKTIKGAENLI